MAEDFVATQLEKTAEINTGGEDAGRTALSREAFNSKQTESPIKIESSGEAASKSIDQLSLLNLRNESEAKAQKDETNKAAPSLTRGLIADLGGVGVSVVAAVTAANLLAKYAEHLPNSVALPIIGVAAIAAGGLANNAISGSNLLAGRGFIRDGVALATTAGAIAALEYIPANHNLSQETLAHLAEAGLKVEGEWSGSQISKLASFPFYPRVTSALLDPMVYTPFRLAPVAEGATENFLSRLQWAGFGGDSTVRLFADGLMDLAEFNAREIAGKSLGNFGVGYGFGALNKAASIWAGDGNSYTRGQYWSALNAAGLKAGIPGFLGGALYKNNFISG